jgi:predicted peroxiredoxin
MKKLGFLLLVLFAGVARAEGLQKYVADDIHTLDAQVQMALTARAALANDTAVVLVRDGQVPTLESKAELVTSAQSKGVKFYVCDTDMRAYKNPSLPDGVEVVDTSPDDHASPRSTISRILSRVCRREGS